MKPAGKFVLYVLGCAAIAGSIFAARKYIVPEGQQTKSISGMMAGPNASGSSGAMSDKKNKCIEIGVNTWGGFIGAQYWNNGFLDNPGSKYHQDGICVNFHKMDDFGPSRNSFRSGDRDLMWSTIDSFPTESGSFGDVKWLFPVDWSRGGDAIVVTDKITSVANLAGKKVAVAETTPSHTFLLWMLDLGGLSITDITVVKVENGIDAAAAFKAGKVDAAVVWSPDDDDCVKAIKNSSVLVSTKKAGSIIADGFFVKASVYNERRDELLKLVRGWYKGAAEVNSSPTAKKKAVQILVDGLGIDAEFALNAINNTHLFTYGDAKDFIGLNTKYTGVTGQELYEKMTKVYGSLNLADNALSWDKIADPQFIKDLNMDTEDGMTSEKKIVFKAPTQTESAAPAIASKPIRVSFAHNSSVLDENGKQLVDLKLVVLIKAFPSSRIRVEGNTDSTGSVSINRTISKARAQSVVDYLVSEHQMDKNRFITVGNGSDKSVCSDESETCMAKNRRTEFQILEN